MAVGEPTLREGGGGSAGAWMVQSLLRPVLVAVMLVCMTMPVVLVLEWLFEGWTGGYFVVFCFAAALEGIWSERALLQRRISGYAYLVSRAAEALVLLIVLKLVSYIPQGWGSLQADLRLLADPERWVQEPGRLVSNQDLLLGFLFLCLWLGALRVARWLRQLDVDDRRGPPPADRTSAEYYLWLTEPSVARDRQGVLERLAEFFMWGGVLVVGASAAVHALLPVGRELAVAALLYFALGVALLSQGRFSVLQAVWEHQSIPVQASVGRRWLLWALLFLAGVALLAILLPTSYAVGPVRALLGVVALLGRALMVVVSLLLFLLSWPLTLLFPNLDLPEEPPAPPVGPTAPGEGAVASSSLPWLEVLGSALFWLVIVGIVGYAVVRVVRDRLGPLEGAEGADQPWWKRLLSWLRDLWRGWWSWGQAVQARLAQRRAEPGSGRLRRLARRGFFSLRRLSPRDLVRYFYLSTLQRAAQAGQPRPPGETPYEYGAALGESFGDLEPELTGLTEAFVRARYSPQPIEAEDAEAVKPLWQRIKTALRRRRVTKL